MRAAAYIILVIHYLQTVRPRVIPSVQNPGLCNVCLPTPAASCCARAACNAAHAVSIAVARCLCQLYKKETGKECIDRTVGDDHVLFIDDVEWVQGYMVRGWRARVALHRHSR